MFSSQILHITTRRAIISLVLCSAPVATFIKHKHSRYNPLFPGQHLCGDASLHRDNPALCRRVHQHLRARGPAGVGARARRDQGLRRVGQLPQRDRQVAGQISRISTISTISKYLQRSDSNTLVLSHRLSPMLTPPVERSPVMTLSLQQVGGQMEL